MCIIVNKPWGVPVERSILETCFVNNPDGAGFMYASDGRLVIRKGFFEFDDFWKSWEKCRKNHGDSLSVVFHFRIATAGEIDKTNCHPHRIAQDLGFVHNGILSCVHVPKGSAASDTIIYRNRYLGSLTGKSLRNAKLFKRIAYHIGAGNKFAFMSGAGKVVICNEEQGVWKDGLWFSNHSFLPRSWQTFPHRNNAWICEYCGNILETPEELAECACRECLAYFDPDHTECGGCRDILSTNSHKAAGWCDECGYEIYGHDWPNRLRYAVNSCEDAVGCDYF